MKRLLSVCIFLLMGFVLPLLPKLYLLVSTKILLLLLACTLIVLTQPPIDWREAHDKQNTDRKSVWVILILSLLSITGSVIEWAYWRDSPSKIGTLNIVGGFMLLSGIVLRLWAIRTLGLFFRAVVQIVEEQALIKKGPYRDIRHPSYLGAYLSFIGMTIWLGAWISVWAVITLMGAAYFYRIQIEEQTLSRHFGTAYHQYKKYSWRMIPGIW